MGNNDEALVPYLDYDLTTAAEEGEQQAKQAEDEAKIFWKPRDGENVIRIVPPPMDWQAWYAEHGLKPTPFFLVWKHFFERPEKPGAWVSTPCPHKMGGLSTCPLCHEAARLRATGDEVDDELGWDMTAKHKALVNVIDRDDEESGPLVWEISAPIGRWKGRTMYEKIRALMTGRNAANIVTPTAKGFDVVVTKTGKGRTGTSYTVEALRSPNALSEDAEQAIGWINSQHDLRQFIIPPTPEQMQAIIEGKAMGPRQAQASVSQASPGQTGGGQGSAPSRSRRSLPAAPPEETAGDFIEGEIVDDDELTF